MSRLFAVLALALVAGNSFAGPFGLFRRGGTTTTTTNNGVSQQVSYNRPFLGTAQGAANYMASILRMGHHGNPTGGYEGVGMGGSPQAAIQNCCFYGKRPLRDSGVAQGANGMWYACCRYN